MEFLDRTSYSPTGEAFTYPDTIEKAYFADSYTTLPDYTFNNYENDTFFDRTTPIIDTAFWPMSQPAISNDKSTGTTLPASTTPGAINTNLDAWSYHNTTPFGGIGYSGDAFTSTGPADLPASPCLSPKSLTRESPSSNATDHHSEEEATVKPPPRKRGRPRLYRQSNASSEGSSASEKVLYPQRLPHNQVERKYREGLNMELERLRRAVPTLPQSEKADVMGAAKPSKAMVLAAAIDYIKKVEKERDAAIYEVERLGGKVRMGMAANC